MKGLKKFKTILRWYSGFYLSWVIFWEIFYIKDTSCDCFETTIGENIVYLILIGLVFIYVFWEIIENLN